MMACLRSAPFQQVEELIEAGEALLEGVLGVIRRLSVTSLPVLVKVLDAFGEDGDFHAAST